MATITKRTRADRSLAWDVRIRVHGNAPACRSFRTKLEAEHWAANHEAALEGRTLVVRGRVTVAELIDQYAPHAKPSTAKLLRYWRASLGPMKLRDVTPALVARHRDALFGAPTRSHGYKTTKPRSGATVRTYLHALSAAFKFAIRELHWAEVNPVANVTKPKGSAWRTRFLTQAERAALLAECRASPHLYAAVLLSLTTGLRQGELYGLKPRDLDMGQRWAILPHTKNGEARGVPLVPAVLDALAPILPADPAARVFDFDLTKQWRGAMQRAKLENFRWHDLRHSAASHLAMSGASTIEIANLLGHRTLHMTKRYSHLANAHTRALLDRVMAGVQ